MTSPDHEALLKGTEIYDTDIPRVDAVHGPATGIPFLIMKSAVTPTSAPAETVRKADAMADELVASDVETPIVQGEEVDPAKANDADMPGSPTWEAVDAAKARTVVSQLTSLRTLIGELAARENSEVDSDASDDSYTAWNLEDAQDAIDCALGTFAKYAVDEQNEADTAAQEAEDAARAMGLIKSLDLAPVVKAGRVLSAANEATLRSMSEQLVALLAQVDTAPVAAEGGETVSVAKAQDPSTPLPVAITALLSQLAVAYTDWEAGGSTPATPDPTVAAPVAADPAADPAATDPTGDPMTDPTATPAAADPAVPAVPVADPAAAPATPAAPAAVTPPADPADPTDPNAVAKSNDKTEVEKSLLQRIEAGIAEHMAKLEKRLVQVESTPVNAGPMLNGALPDGHTAPTGGPAEQLLKQMQFEQDPAKRMDGVATLLASGLLPRI